MDSRLNNKSLLTLSKILARIAVQINPGMLSGMQAAVPSDTSPRLPTTTPVTPSAGAAQRVRAAPELYVLLGKMS